MRITIIFCLPNYILYSNYWLQLDYSTTVITVMNWICGNKQRKRKKKPSFIIILYYCWYIILKVWTPCRNPDSPPTHCLCMCHRLQWPRQDFPYKPKALSLLGLNLKSPEVFGPSPVLSPYTIDRIFTTCTIRVWSQRSTCKRIR